MLRRTSHTVKPHALWKSYSQSAGAGAGAGRRALPRAAILLATASAVAVGAHLARGQIHNDAFAGVTVESKRMAEESRAQEGRDMDGRLRLLVWGSNKSHTIMPDKAGVEQVRSPAAASFLEDVALRDLALHASHAACVDVRGDVYQWGDGFFRSADVQDRTPVPTLKGKNIVRLQLTDSRVFALSSSGSIYVLSARASEQQPVAGETASSSRWGTSWLYGSDSNIACVELKPSQALRWGEKFVSIAAGKDHLLALTSSGRAFAHPITKKANTHGQLGFRKFDIAEHLQAELTPLAVADPYARSSRLPRLPSSSSSSEPQVSPVSESLKTVDDRDLAWCGRLYEIPALRDVKVGQIAAGSKSSFARTESGRVLGWGANEYGQIGLGGNVVVDTITIPTEVVLWRGTDSRTRTKCIDVAAGGDLSFFTVERQDGTFIQTVDLLSCGNGQYGGLGSAMFTTAQGVPARTKAISGLAEFSEKTKNLQPILPKELSVSPDGHALLALDTLTRAGPGAGGKDLFLWGTNYEYQLGNGRRTSVAVPATLEWPDGARFMLMRRKAAVVRDARGGVWGRNVTVEQMPVAGVGCSAVYWKVC
ncbi:RCC1/BLIP-II [Dentipellis sp. KUC8613]|nr:RCC1/BLIP-II [Dentipellis sp. KUC8613]